MSTNEKLSDEIANYFHTFKKCAYDSPDEIIAAVRALEREVDKARADAERTAADNRRLTAERDEARNSFRTLDDELNKRTDKLLDVAKERDAALSARDAARDELALAEARVEASINETRAVCKAEVRAVAEHDAALAKLDALGESIIGVRQQRDRFATEASEWEKWCKAQTAKLKTAELIVTHLEVWSKYLLKQLEEIRAWTNERPNHISLYASLDDSFRPDACVELVRATVQFRVLRAKKACKHVTLPSAESLLVIKVKCAECGVDDFAATEVPK